MRWTKNGRFSASINDIDLDLTVALYFIQLVARVYYFLKIRWWSSRQFLIWAELFLRVHFIFPIWYNCYDPSTATRVNETRKSSVIAVRHLDFELKTLGSINRKLFIWYWGRVEELEHEAHNREPILTVN